MSAAFVQSEKKLHFIANWEYHRNTNLIKLQRLFQFLTRPWRQIQAQTEHSHSFKCLSCSWQAGELQLHPVQSSWSLYRRNMLHYWLWYLCVVSVIHIISFSCYLMTILFFPIWSLTIRDWNVIPEKLFYLKLIKKSNFGYLPRWKKINHNKIISPIIRSESSQLAVALKPENMIYFCRCFYEINSSHEK